jgi:hypothetical protein
MIKFRQSKLIPAPDSGKSNVDMKKTCLAPSDLPVMNARQAAAAEIDFGLCLLHYPAGD